MHYEINVSLNGAHLFATAPRSCTDESDARRVYAELDKRFPVEEGFSITVTRYSTSGSIIDLGASS